MRRHVLAWLMWCLIFTEAAGAQDKKAPPGVRELDLEGLKRQPERNPADKPVLIMDAAGLARAFPKGKVRARLLKDVDFAKEQLLFFAWFGSFRDRLTARIGDATADSQVEFVYLRASAGEQRGHFRLFALPRNATWKVTIKRVK